MDFTDHYSEKSDITGVIYIYEYVKKQYETANDHLKRIDTKMTHNITILGILIAFVTALIPHLFILSGGFLYWWLILFPYFFALYEITRIAFCCLDLFFETYPIPGISKNLTLVQQSENINAAILIQEFTENYIKAIEVQQIRVEERKKKIKKLNLHFKRCIIALLLSLALIVFLSKSTAGTNIKQRLGVTGKMSIQDDAKPTMQDTTKENEVKSSGNSKQISEKKQEIRQLSVKSEPLEFMAKQQKPIKTGDIKIEKENPGEKDSKE